MATVHARPGQDNSDPKFHGYYTAVINGSYNPRTECFEWRYDENHTTFVSAKVLARTVQRLKDGYDHVTADPRFGLTRYEAGYLFANADKLLKTINGTKFAYPES